MTMKDLLRRRFLSFTHAIDGIEYVLRTQPNSRIHCFFTVLVLVIAAILHVSLVEFAILVMAIGFVWAAELFNTAVEVTIDLVSPQQHPLAKAIKDVSAGGVLISAITAVILGLVIFAPPLLKWLGFR